MFRRNDGITIEHERIRPLRNGQRWPGVVAASNVPNAGYRERRSEGVGRKGEDRPHCWPGFGSAGGGGIEKGLLLRHLIEPVDDSFSINGYISGGRTLPG